MSISIRPYPRSQQENKAGIAALIAAAQALK
jgi:hypothetical protein